MSSSNAKTSSASSAAKSGSGWVKNNPEQAVKPSSWVKNNPDPTVKSGWDDGPQMYVIKRSGAKEAIAFDKISKRLKKCCKEIQTVEINTTKFALRVIEQLHDNITTQKIDEITADLAASMSSHHYDYNTLAGRIIISNMHKSTPTTFSKSVKKLYQYVDKHGKACPLISAEYYQTVMAHAKVLDALCGDCSRDYLIDYFGFKTLEKAYLMRVNGVVVERPQYMWMRVAVALHMGSVGTAVTVGAVTVGKGTEGTEKCMEGAEGTVTDPMVTVNQSDAMLDRIRETYEMLSSKHFIMATPTLFNIGTPRPQCSSCFLVAMEEDSVDGIFSTLTDCARISKYAGGIGLHIHNIRATGSHINGTNGTSDGIVPMLRMFNQTARYINQSGKRNGSFAIYLEPWHADVEMFLQMKTNHGDEELKARDLFYAMWIPDLFMERVKSEGQWTLMCPDECRGLADVYGDEFTKLYESYEKAGKGRATMPARDLWLKILDAQMETGTPYLLYKDAANRKSNQKNLGTIKSSNLCVEIVQYSDKTETSVCNLSSIALPAFVSEEGGAGPTFDFEKLHKVARQVTYNLNRVIDINYYPTEKARRSNMRHRPIGIGVQGLADTFMMMGMPFGDEASRLLNREIFETIYHAALTESCELAKQYGAYETFEGSPASEGLLQYDLWDTTPILPFRYDWDGLKNQICKYGLRNSLLVAPMPTASTSQILGYNECIEPITSNIYSRRTLAGEFIVANKYLMRELLKLGLWNEQMKNAIVANNGSVQGMTEIPADIRHKYRTVWEIPMRALIDMAADRGVYVCQSQSLNLWMEDPNYKTLTAMHFYSWSKGLKSGIYYLRRQARSKAQQFTIVPEKRKNADEDETEDANGCEMCSA